MTNMIITEVLRVISRVLMYKIMPYNGSCTVRQEVVMSNLVYIMVPHLPKYQVLLDVTIIRECGSTLYVGMPQKQNARPIHCIAKSPNNLPKLPRNQF